ncbi:MAG: ankyrin repeat domain-containing protein [Bryobacteraceae bacterium]|nr:ankyrin repeat domain-containing protein [Bryobacteraceae bacterium]
MSNGETERLKLAIDRNDLDEVRALMTANPSLHTAPLGYGGDGPLTWVAECRVPWEPPSPARLAIARWMIENGSDVHQGGDGPLMRASLNAGRIPMMDLLVSMGADVNAEWHGWFPILFSPCESAHPVTLQWLLDHGANPNCSKPGVRGTALDYLIGTYARSPGLAKCIDLLLARGASTRYDQPGVLEILRGRTDELAAILDAEPGLARRRIKGLDAGSTGGRGMLLDGATLLHVAAEFANLEAAELLLKRGADVNSPAEVNIEGIGGQTAIFHSVSQYGDAGLEMTRLLLDRGAGLSVRAKLPSHYDRPGECVECNPLEYAMLFPGGENATVALLRERAGLSAGAG